MKRKFPIELSLWFLLVLALLITLLTGCETPPKVTSIPVKPLTPLDGDTTAQPPLKRTAKITLPKIVRSEPQNAVAPPPQTPTITLSWKRSPAERVTWWEKSTDLRTWQFGGFLTTNRLTLPKTNQQEFYRIREAG